MGKRLIPAVILVLVATGLLRAQTYDIIIRNGRVVDGSGNPWYAGDVAIRNGRIAAIGSLCLPGPCDAKRTIDAQGLVVAPGFIDVHTHADSGVQRNPGAANYVFDGVTSVIAGNCGGSPSDLGNFFSDLRQRGISINFGSLIGHGTVRSAVMRMERRDPTPEELARMSALVEQAMRDGAVGLSTGLIYTPGSWAKTEEIISLARVAAKFGGIYATHLRNEGNDEQGGVFDAIEEALKVGREAGIPVEISHFKVAGKDVWGKSDRTIAMVENARAAGLDVTVDQYPYTASSTGLASMLPGWVQEGGREKYLERLSDPATRRRLINEVKERVRRRGFKRLDYAVVARCASDSSLEGKSITAINQAKGRKKKLESEIETALDILAKGGASMIYHSMDEKDVERIMRSEYSMVASDGGIVEFGVGVPHPRNYATNARVLARYVRERRVLRLEEAIRKMTSLPAQRFCLVDRGLIRPGLCADLVVFDDRTVSDVSTYEKPHALSTGFHYVIVNGTVVIENAQHTGARPGQILLGPGARQASEAPTSAISAIAGAAGR
ncbi:MAG: D-aminoacylase [Acidobacteria bacterium]|nr:MAG: D-aminoacylase [Acidobacteriota bacterium]